jgi:MFS family permease
MRSRAVWSIGCGQLVNWGVLYYAFSVLLVPLEQSLDAPRWLVAGAFSVALLVSAIAAPAVGRLADRGQGPAAIQAGGLFAAGLLIGWAAAPSILLTYIVWAALGLCMAAILYEPAFAIIGRAFENPGERLRAIATVTVMGGLASTVFVPGTAAMVDALGWRAAVIVLALAMALTTLVTSAVAFTGHQAIRPSGHQAIRPSGQQAMGPSRQRGQYLSRLVAVFAISSVVNSAVSANLVAALIDRGLTASLAAAIGGLFGVMQLPGRLLMTRPAFTPGAFAMLLASFAMQMIGLAALIIPASHAGIWIGVATFAGGAGLTTLARPYLVLHLCGPEHAGHANGVIARGQQLARAAGPVSAAALATMTGYGSVFASLALLLSVAGILVVKERPNLARPLQV